MQQEQLVTRLSSRFYFRRLASLKRLSKSLDVGSKRYYSNRILLNTQSKYSFGPYYPSMIAYRAYVNGLKSAGITDFLTVKGAKEMRKACAILGIFYITGYRLNTNSPITDGGEVIMSVYGVPKQRVKEVDSRLKVMRQDKYYTQKNIVKNVNKAYKKYGIKLDFETDVVDTSTYRKGGALTEKHVFYALSHKIVQKFGKGKLVVDFVEKDLGITLDQTSRSQIIEEDNPYYEFDLARIIKDIKYYQTTHLISDVEAVATAHEEESIICLECKSNLVEEVKRYADRAQEIGADGVAFVSSNFDDQILEELCTYITEKELLAIDLEVMDEPRKKFGKDIKSQKVIDLFKKNADVILGHEMAVSSLSGDGFNSDKIKSTWKNFAERVELFAGIAQKDLS